MYIVRKFLEGLHFDNIEIILKDKLLTISKIDVWLSLSHYILLWCW